LSSGSGPIIVGVNGTGNDQASGYELAFEEAGRALDAQERAVNELRSRAGVLMAAAAITTSFFGSRAVTGDALSIGVWIAVAAFVVVEPEPVEFRLLQRDLALHRSAAYDANAEQLGRLFLVFRIGLVVLVAEVAAWVVALAERG
jgi:hypothetical protein